MNIPGISFDIADDNVFLISQPLAGRLPVDGTLLRQLLQEQGYGGCALDEEAINKAASLCNTQQGQFEMQVALRVHATVKVTVASDNLSAMVDITAPQGGKAATVADVMAALTLVNVVCGIDNNAVEDACLQGRCTKLVVARGTEPTNGTDTVLKVLIAKTIDREPKLDENGMIDYREHGDIPVVKVGDALMRRVPGTPGLNGQTVKGIVLLATAGRDAVFASNLSGVQTSPDDPNLLVAAVNGQPIRVDGGMAVEPVLRLKEVNMATGNIHFDGTVHISGEVIQGMKVQASGDIVVDGMVDGGHLHAGGNIMVAGGVIAHAELHAGVSVSARFAESSQISAGTVIAISDMAIDCTLHSLHHILIGVHSPHHGRLVGGVTSAAMLLQVPVLGSAKACVTKVIVGEHPELDAKYAELEHRIEEEKAKEENLAKIIKQIKATGDPKGMLGRVKASRQHAMQVWGQSLAEEAALKRELAESLTAKIEVTVGVEGAVTVSFGKQTVPLRHDFEAGTFSIDPTTMAVIFTRQGGQDPLPV